MLSLALLMGSMLRSTRFPAADGPHMLSQAWRLSNMLHEGRVWESILAISTLSAPHPPFAYVPMILLIFLGLPLRAVVAGWDVLWLLALWQGCVNLCRSSVAGGLAFVVGSTAALTWWSADQAGFDLPAAATIVQALGWMVASDGFVKRRESVWFGIWLGAAFLTKYSTPMILVLPVLIGGLPGLRQPKNLFLAVVAWAVVALPWLVGNQHAVLDYVSSALNPPVAPGNFPEQRTLLDRFAGEGQGMFIAVLKDTLGWPVLGLLAIGALGLRRRVPLLGVVSGLLFLGAMNSREGRYALPLVFLLAAAATPPARWGWQPVVMLLAVLAPGWKGVVSSYEASGDETPSRRSLRHHISSLSTLSPWPQLVSNFSPIAEHPELWKVNEVFTTAQAHLKEPVLGLLLDTMLEAPTEAVYQLVGEQGHFGIDLLSVHVMDSPEGLRTDAYRGPLSVQDNAPPPAPGNLRREPSTVRVFYVVTHASRPLGLRWLAETPHTELAQWDLPAGYRGQLIEKIQ